MSQLSGFKARISGEVLPYEYTFIFEIEELSRLSGCPNEPVSLISEIDCIQLNHIY